MQEPLRCLGNLSPFQVITLPSHKLPLYSHPSQPRYELPQWLPCALVQPTDDRCEVKGLPKLQTNTGTWQHLRSPLLSTAQLG